LAGSHTAASSPSLPFNGKWIAGTSIDLKIGSIYCQAIRVTDRVASSKFLYTLFRFASVIDSSFFRYN